MEEFTVFIPAVIKFLDLAGSHPVTGGLLGASGIAFVLYRWRMKDNSTSSDVLERLAAHDKNDAELKTAVDKLEAKLDMQQDQLKTIDQRTFDISTTIHAFLEVNRGKQQ